MKKLLSAILFLVCLMMAAAAQAQFLVPMEPGELSTTDADYCVRFAETDHIGAGGYFVIRRVDLENDRLFALAEKESACAP